jgi:hypothetical protein
VQKNRPTQSAGGGTAGSIRPKLAGGSAEIVASYRTLADSGWLMGVRAAGRIAVTKTPRWTMVHWMLRAALQMIARIKGGGMCLIRRDQTL